MIPILYHVLMLGLDFFMLWLLTRQKRTTVRLLFLLCALGGCGALLLGLLARRNIQLFAEGLFWHGGVFLLLAGLWVIRQTVDHRRRWKLGTGLILLSLIVLGVGIEAMLLEPTWLVVKRYQFRTSKITKPVRIAFLTDIQTDKAGKYERRTLQRLKEQNADLILFGGDYVQARNFQQEDPVYADLNRLFREAQLQAPLGIWAVQGNVDLGNWKRWTRLFDGTPIKPVEQSISFSEGELSLTLLGVYDSFRTTRRYPPPQAEQLKYRILLGHAPCYALAGQQADLMLSGHTHGGQIWIPGFGPLLTMSPRLPRKWASGLTQLPNGSKLIVSNGSGMERGGAPRVRLFCRPQLVVVDLIPEKPAGQSTVGSEP